MPSTPTSDRRDDERAGKADAIGARIDREIGADGVEPAMREIDDAAEREDQREAERDQQIVGADQEAVENLLEDEDELHARLPTKRDQLLQQLGLPVTPSEQAVRGWLR